jgi:hypothetical protein
MTLLFAPTSDLHFEVLELLELRSEHAAHLVGLGSHLVEGEHELRVDSAELLREEEPQSCPGCLDLRVIS